MSVLFLFFLEWNVEICQFLRQISLISGQLVQLLFLLLMQNLTVQSIFARKIGGWNAKFDTCDYIELSISLNYLDVFYFLFIFVSLVVSLSLFLTAIFLLHHLFFMVHVPYFIRKVVQSCDCFEKRMCSFRISGYFRK